MSDAVTITVENVHMTIFYDGDYMLYLLINTLSMYGVECRSYQIDIGFGFDSFSEFITNIRQYATDEFF